MYLVTDTAKSGKKRSSDGSMQPAELGGLNGVLIRGWHWWKERGIEQRRRQARKQMFVLETMVLGPKQRVVLLRCGAERFLVGMGAEGVTSVVRVEDGLAPEGLPLVAGGDGHWG